MIILYAKALKRVSKHYLLITDSCQSQIPNNSNRPPSTTQDLESEEMGQSCNGDLYILLLIACHVQNMHNVKGWVSDCPELPPPRLGRKSQAHVSRLLHFRSFSPDMPNQEISIKFNQSFFTVHRWNITTIYAAKWYKPSSSPRLSSRQLHQSQGRSWNDSSEAIPEPERLEMDRDG